MGSSASCMTLISWRHVCPILVDELKKRAKWNNIVRSCFRIQFHPEPPRLGCTNLASPALNYNALWTYSKIHTFPILMHIEHVRGNCSCVSTYTGRFSQILIMQHWFNLISALLYLCACMAMNEWMLFDIVPENPPFLLCVFIITATEQYHSGVTALVSSACLSVLLPFQFTLCAATCKVDI